MRERYVMRGGKLVAKQSASASFQAMSDIQPFVTQDGVEITSRSALRDYERANGVRQCGNDWTGSKPRWWDEHMASRGKAWYDPEKWSRR